MSEPLTLSFHSDTTAARNAIANLAGTVVSNMLTIGSAMKAANDNVGKLQSGISALPTILRTAAAGFIAFEAIKLSMEAVGNAAAAAREKLQEIVDVAKNAQTAGVGTNFFQEWTHQAAGLNIETEKLVGMLDRAREATTVHLGTQGNASSSAMQDLLGLHVAAGNIGAGDVSGFNAADSQEKKIRVILDLIDKLMASGKQLAALNIGEKMFGAEFANQLRNGVDLTGRMRESLTNIKDVKFPPDIVAKAKELDDQLKSAQETMERGWAPVQQDILRWQQTMLQNVANMKTLFADIVGILGEWYTAVKKVGHAVDELSNSNWIQQLNKFMESQGLLSLPRYEQGHVPSDGMTDGERRPLTVRPGPDTSRPLPKTSTGASTTDEVDTYIKQLQKSVEVLKAENATYGLSNTAKAEAVDLEKALAAARSRGTPLTDAEREAVKKLADEEGAAKDKTEQLTKATEGANARAAFLGEQLVSVAEKIGQHGTRARDVILDIAKALEKAALQAAFLGTGPLAQLFGTGGTGGNAGGLAGLLLGGGGLFRNFGFGGGYGASDYASAAAAAPAGMYGPGFDGGGMVGRDGTPTFIPAAALARARHFDAGGGIPAIVHPGEIVLNAAQQKNVAAGLGGGPSINLTHAPVFNGTGLSKEEVVAVGLQLQKGFARQIGPILADWQRRHG